MGERSPPTGAVAAVAYQLISPVWETSAAAYDVVHAGTYSACTACARAEGRLLFRVRLEAAARAGFDVLKGLRASLVAVRVLTNAWF